MKKYIIVLVSLLFLLLSANFVLSENIKLTWDANTETDLAGYKIYDSLTDGGPYTLVKDVGNVTEFTIDVTSKPDGPIYYVATAYDLRGNESDFSKSAEYIVDHTAPQAPGGCKIVVIGK